MTDTGRRRSATPPRMPREHHRRLSSAAETRHLAGQVNKIGRMDAVIHNAAVFLEPSRAATADGHAKTLAVNTLAPYLLTALIGRPDRLIYLSSGLHHRLWPGIVNAIVVPSRTAAPSRSQPSSSGASLARPRGSRAS